MKSLSELLLFTVSVIFSALNVGSTENYRSAVKSHKGNTQEPYLRSLLSHPCIG